MEYTSLEKDVLSMMNRTNFKNLSKSDVISFTSRLGELRPEVAKEILAHYPEFVELMRSTLSEYQGIINALAESDDKSLGEYYAIVNKEMDIASDSRKQFYEFVKQVQLDYSKCLDDPNLSPEMLIEILDREAELIKIANEKDAEIRKQKKELEERANKKDTERRELNWKLAGTVSLALVAIAGISAGVLGGKFDFKLPEKS